MYNKDSFLPGSFGHTSNICGDSTPCVVVKRYEDSSGLFVETKPVHFELKDGVSRGMGASFTEGDVKEWSVVEEAEAQTFQWDEERKAWRGKLLNRKTGKVATKRVLPKNITYKRLFEGFYSYYNPHI